MVAVAKPAPSAPSDFTDGEMETLRRWNELAEMLRAARAFAEWLEWWDRDGAIEAQLTPSEISARRAMKARAA